MFWLDLQYVAEKKFEGEMLIKLRVTLTNIYEKIL